VVSLQQPIIMAMNLYGVRRYQGLRRSVRELSDMNENSGPAHRDQISARSAFDTTRPARWSGLSYGALFLAAFASNIVLAVFAWFLVEWAMRLI
jgi:hypothetical protein